jgi:hypothetical protein
VALQLANDVLHAAAAVGSCQPSSRVCSRPTADIHTLSTFWKKGSKTFLHHALEPTDELLTLAAGAGRRAVTRHRYARALLPWAMITCTGSRLRHYKSCCKRPARPTLFLPADCAFVQALLIQRSTSHCKVTPSTISLTLAYNRLTTPLGFPCKTLSETLECSRSKLKPVARAVPRVQFSELLLQLQHCSGSSSSRPAMVSPSQRTSSLNKLSYCNICVQLPALMCLAAQPRGMRCS